MTTSARRRVFCVAAALAFATGAAYAGATQWDMTSGPFHTHLIAHPGGFELHIHSKATHKSVDTSKGTVVATLLAGGKSTTIPLAIKQVGILVGKRELVGDWVMLFRLDVPGMKSAQLRYSSKMKTAAHAAKKK